MENADLVLICSGTALGFLGAEIGNIPISFLGLVLMVMGCIVHYSF
jgi:hypothetical protein